MTPSKHPPCSIQRSTRCFSKEHKFSFCLHEREIRPTVLAMKLFGIGLVLCLCGLANIQAADFDQTQAVGEYFRTYNDPIAETPFTQNTPRKFSWVQKVNAFDRDGWKCVACGATNRLEMDHAVALMNGGPNELANLHPLCHACHIIKTRMDRALKRHRVQLAKQQAAARTNGTAVAEIVTAAEAPSSPNKILP